MIDLNKLNLNTALTRAADFTWRLDVLNKMQNTFDAIVEKREAFIDAGVLGLEDERMMHFADWVHLNSDLEAFLLKADPTYCAHA